MLWFEQEMLWYDSAPKCVKALRNYFNLLLHLQALHWLFISLCWNWTKSCWSFSITVYYLSMLYASHWFILNVLLISQWQMLLSEMLQKHTKCNITIFCLGVRLLRMKMQSALRKLDFSVCVSIVHGQWWICINFHTICTSKLKMLSIINIFAVKFVYHVLAVSCKI